MYHTTATPREDCAITPRDDTRGKRLDSIPKPEGIWWSIEAACLEFEVSRRRLWNVLSEHRANLGKPYYKRRADGRLERRLSATDMAYLRTIFRWRVKS